MGGFLEAEIKAECSGGASVMTEEFLVGSVGLRKSRADSVAHSFVHLVGMKLSPHFFRMPQGLSWVSLLEERS